MIAWLAAVALAGSVAELERAAAESAVVLASCARAPEACDRAELAAAWYDRALLAWVRDFALDAEAAGALRVLDPARFALLPEPVRAGAGAPPAWLTPPPAPPTSSPQSTSSPAPPAGSDAARLAEARALVRDHGALDGALLVWARMGEATDGERAADRVVLAEALVELRLPLAAWTQNLRAIREAPGSEAAAVAAEGLVGRSTRWALVQRAVAEVPALLDAPELEPRLRIARAERLAAAGDVEGALALVRSVPDDHPFRGRALWTEARIAAEAGQPKTAMTALRALSESPATSLDSSVLQTTARLAVARTFVALGRPEDAVARYAALGNVTPLGERGAAEVAWVRHLAGAPMRAADVRRAIVHQWSPGSDVYGTLARQDLVEAARLRDAWRPLAPALRASADRLRSDTPWPTLDQVPSAGQPAQDPLRLDARGVSLLARARSVRWSALDGLPIGLQEAARGADDAAVYMLDELEALGPTRSVGPRHALAGTDLADDLQRDLWAEVGALDAARVHAGRQRAHLLADELDAWVAVLDAFLAGRPLPPPPLPELGEDPAAPS